MFIKPVSSGLHHLRLRVEGDLNNLQLLLQDSWKQYTQSIQHILRHAWSTSTSSLPHALLDLAKLDLHRSVCFFWPPFIIPQLLDFPFKLFRAWFNSVMHEIVNGICMLWCSPLLRNKRHINNPTLSISHSPIMTHYLHLCHFLVVLFTTLGVALRCQVEHHVRTKNIYRRFIAGPTLNNSKKRS